MAIVNCYDSRLELNYYQVECDDCGINLVTLYPDQPKPMHFVGNASAKRVAKSRGWLISEVPPLWLCEYCQNINQSKG